MTGQMCWLSAFGSEYKILHLRLQSHQVWQPYTALSHLAVADYDVPGSSKGMATYHVLSQAGWQLVATKDARRAISAPSQQDVA